MSKWKPATLLATAALLAACGTEPTSPVSMPDAPGHNTSSTLSVTIVGPNLVRLNRECTWEVTVTGGTPPYTYLWTAWDLQYSYDSVFRSSVHEIGAHALYVEVEDALGNMGSDGMSVTGSNSLYAAC